MASTSPMMHAEAVRRLRTLMKPEPPRRGVWAGWWASVRPVRRHTPFKDTRRGIDRRIVRLFTLRES